jgi:hypothetical protein
MLVAGTGAANSGPATDLPAPLTRPYDKHREPPKETVGVFYQHMDNMLLVLSCFEASITGTRFSNFYEKETNCSSGRAGALSSTRCEWVHEP